MPLINGMKMACEPCIRGHRSTKCTHANERLMVPVKKPGRPLSACPHLHNQLCGCSSITAAIPRKQKCHCGTGASAGSPLALQPRAAVSAIPDVPSATKISFRVQKPPLSSRPASRKQSYDLSTLERMDASNLNITPYLASASQPALGQAILNGHSKTSINGLDTNNSQCPQSSVGIQNPILQSEYPDLSFPPDNTNGEYSAGYSAPGSAIFASDGSYHQLEPYEENSAEDTKVSGVASCCAAKQVTNKDDMAFRSQLYGEADCEASPGSSGAPLTLSAVTLQTPETNGHPEPEHYFFTDNLPAAQNVYSSFDPKPIIYEYPASYGSYQRPLQPSQWRRDFRSNVYAQPAPQPEMMNELAPFPSDIFSDQMTLHSCSCGDACQCIGCAAHPYNSATRNCVRSAYIISHELSTSANGKLSNGHNNNNPFTSNSDPHTNGNAHIHNDNEEISPSHGDTPPGSSPTEEQALPASDYIFVNYPFSSDGCGGDTNSCPCGDDCECIGCTIHRFDESSTAFPSNAWANGETSTNGDSAEISKGISIKDENLVNEFAGESKEVVVNNKG